MDDASKVAQEHRIARGGCRHRGRREVVASHVATEPDAGAIPTAVRPYPLRLRQACLLPKKVKKSIGLKLVQPAAVSLLRNKVARPW